MALRNTKNQAATMSPEAIKYLAAIPHPWIPGFLLPALTGLTRVGFFGRKSEQVEKMNKTCYAP